MVETEKKLCR